MSSQLEIYNRALNLAGTRSDVSALDEVSREAELCQLWYPSVRDTILAGAYWPSAKGIVRLSLLSTREEDTWVPTEPAIPWLYAYSRPADYLRARFVSDMMPFEVGLFGEFPAILTNRESAILTYTRKITNTALFDPLLEVAIFTGLAAQLSGPLTGSRRKAESLFQQANNMLLQAREMNSNESSQTFESIPSWLSARGVGGDSYPNRYVYPVGPLLVDLGG